MKNIIILISGEGSNLRAIVDVARRDQWARRLGAQVAAVISNRADAPGLAWARNEGIPTAVVDHTAFASRAAFDAAMENALEKHGPPALVVLAGFMRILTPAFVRRYEGRLINIHPSLLPAFTGLNTHQRAIDEGCTNAGATVHRVTAQLDHGAILAQVQVPILAGDSAATLAARVQVQEHVLYPSAIAALLEGLN